MATRSRSSSFFSHSLFAPEALQHALPRPGIAPRGQPGHNPFPHRSLPSPVVLQPRVTVELNFFALSRAHTRTLDATFLPGKHHVARLLSQRKQLDAGSGW